MAGHAAVTTQFLHYIDIENDLPVLADSTDVEICADVQAMADSRGGDGGGESDDDAGNMDQNNLIEDIHPTTFSDGLQIDCAHFVLRPIWRKAAAGATNEFTNLVIRIML